MLDKPPTPPSTLARARQIAIGNGVRYAYTGNVVDPLGSRTICRRCQAAVIERDGYRVRGWCLTDDGHCQVCGERCAGVFDGPPGNWGSRRLPVRLRDFSKDNGPAARTVAGNRADPPTGI
jgi:pyruvate formate lyase activating enzyme